MNQKGFANIALIILLVIVVGGGVGYIVLMRTQEPAIEQSPTPSPITTRPPTPIDETANWKIFQNEKYGLEVKYPSTWELFDENDLSSFGLSIIFKPSDHWYRRVYLGCIGNQEIPRSENASGIGNTIKVIISGEEITVFGKNPDPDENYGPTPIGFSVSSCGTKKVYGRNCLTIESDYDPITEEDREFMQSIKFTKDIDSWSPPHNSCTKG